MNNDILLRLAPGFRFQPTDEELVLHYLMRKVQSLPLPASVIPEADVCRSDPWDLPGDARQERYFFATMEIKYPNGRRSNRATRSGYWKATGLDRQIVDSRSKTVVGTKKTLVFYLGKPPNGSRTNWIMHEYKLFNPTQEMAKWVLCRMFQKRRPRKEEEETVERSKAVVHDFMGDDGRRPRHKFDLNLDYVSGSSSSSGSSGVTHAADEEASSN